MSVINLLVPGETSSPTIYPHAALELRNSHSQRKILYIYLHVSFTTWMQMVSSKEFGKNAFPTSGPYDVDSISYDNVDDDDDDSDNSLRSDGSESKDHSSHTEIDSTTNGINSKEANYNNAIAEVHRAIKDQDRAVFWWRHVVKIIMISMAIMLTIMTCVLLRQSENRDFEAALLVYGKTIISKVNVELQILGGSLEAYSDGVTSYSIYSALIPGRSPWPYVTIPNDEFVAHAEHVVSLSQDDFVWITPIVDDVAKWEEYCFTSMVGKTPMSPYTYSYNEDGIVTVANGTGSFTKTPIHQVYPEPAYFANVNGSIINYDTSSDLGIKNAITSVNALGAATLSGLLSFPLIRDAYSNSFDATEPLSIYIEPIYSAFRNAAIVGYVQSLVEWKFLLSRVGESDAPVVSIIQNTCGDSFSYLIQNRSVSYISMDEAQSTILNGVSVSSFIGIDDDASIEKTLKAGACLYTMAVYPTKEYRQQFNSSVGLYTAVVSLAMMVMVGSFFAYDHFVKRRNEIVVQSAVRSTAIVSAMFPANVRARLYEEQDDNANRRQKKHGNLKAYLRDGSSSALVGGHDTRDIDSKPLADLFTETTVLFADIAGFTAWSSVREPCQVFILLETLYAAFDAIANRRRIFKVETIGDCYVAVTGLPEPRADHAVAMCKFAIDMIKAMRKLTKQMESKLGPETGDLTLRIGLHSGPVTAGVLRGERARFQLFGDTMNTAARMEQTCMKNKIQLSQTTADSLIASGKSNWLQLREEKVMAKGKGELITYWLEVNSQDSACKSSRSSLSGGDDETGDDESENDDNNRVHADIGSNHFLHTPTLQKRIKTLSEKTKRLINWNVDVMLRLLQQIVATRRDGNESTKLPVTDVWESYDELVQIRTNPFDEVKEILPLPQEKKKHRDSSTIVIPMNVTNQLRDYLSHIASMYNENQFHNFEHASHVTMSVTKLLSRIVAPADVLNDFEDRSDLDLVSTLHDHTYGITSDPLTQFACIFAALIHDVDHAGVPNTQLVQENILLAQKYDGKSVAEQNSIDLAWTLLMQDDYKELCRTICATKSELIRFRQLVVNAVMATDIMDKELKQIRNTRWTKAFEDEGQQQETDQSTHRGGNLISSLSKKDVLDQVNRKATIVIEHLIQASDVSHTMQHWHIYRKWNERYFWECYEAYEKNRSTINPLDVWYEGELGFYDYYIIPLAKKLQECGVFGVSSAEYLQYALNNRSEWEIRGRTIVAQLQEEVLSRTTIAVSTIKKKVRTANHSVVADVVAAADTATTAAVAPTTNTFSNSSNDTSSNEIR